MRPNTSEGKHMEIKAIPIKVASTNPKEQLQKAVKESRNAREALRDAQYRVRSLDDNLIDACIESGIRDCLRVNYGLLGKYLRNMG